MTICPGAVLVPLALYACPARVELPEPVREMVEAAIATGDRRKVAVVVEIAKQTNPDHEAEIDRLQRKFLDTQARIAASEAARRTEEIRHAGLLENWNGKGQIGAFQSSGNSEAIGISASVALQRDGLDWTHKLSGAVDYQYSNGRTTREQIIATYEPRYQLNPEIFTFALGRYERDKFQGFSSRYSLSGGIGGRLIASDPLQLSIKAGPTWRWTNFVLGGQDSRVAALAAMDFKWQLANRVSLTEDTSLVVEKGNTSVLSTTGLEAGINSDLKARISYTVDYDSNPPIGAVQTDTLTRFTMVYDF